MLFRQKGDFMTGSPEAVLKEYFGYDSFRTGQAEVVNSLLSGHDVLAIMPTGAGKSICFQVPALMMTHGCGFPADFSYERSGGITDTPGDCCFLCQQYGSFWGVN